MWSIYPAPGVSHFQVRGYRRRLGIRSHDRDVILCETTNYSDRNDILTGLSELILRTSLCMLLRVRVHVCVKCVPYVLNVSHMRITRYVSTHVVVK